MWTGLLIGLPLGIVIGRESAVPEVRELARAMLHNAGVWALIGVTAAICWPRTKIGALRVWVACQRRGHVIQTIAGSDKESCLRCLKYRLVKDGVAGEWR